MSFKEMDKEAQLVQDIADIKKKTNDILTILRGRQDADEPEGLIYQVSMNTRFRKNVNRLFWIIIAANAGVLIMAVSYFITNMGG